MLVGETLSSGAPKTCEDCGVTLQLKVMYSGAGYYIGTECHCGPYSRESDYYPTCAKAADHLAKGDFHR